MNFPNINPVAIHLFGPFSLRWYSVAYLVGLFVSIFYLRTVNQRESFADPKKLDDIVIYAFFWSIFFARVFYVFVYNPSFYFTNPLQIFFVWEGGLSFYGGLIGAITSLFFYSKRFHIPTHKMLDNLASTLSVGVFFGRIANFINAELYGRPTDRLIGVVFPTDSLGLPRHPSQLYEAFCEGALLWLIMLLLSKRPVVRNVPYLRFLIWVDTYSFFRFFLEFFREPDWHIGFLFGVLTIGQILCLVAFSVGIYLTIRVALGSFTSRTKGK